MMYTIDSLLKGKETIIKNKSYLSTKAYVEPFLNVMSKYTNDFRVQAITPDQITKNNDNEDITFNRVLIEAVLPDQIDSHDHVIGFLYGLDVKSPVAKMYKGYLNSACTNLTVFKSSWLNVQEVHEEEPLDYSIIDRLLKEDTDFKKSLDKLKNTLLNRSDRLRYLGEWVDYSLREFDVYSYGKIKIASSLPISAYTELFINSESDYFIPEGINPTMFDVYNSFTQIITDDKKDILNKFEKTLLVNRLLKV